MNAVLTPDQRQALASTKEGYLRLTDPETKENYVLIRADIYDRFQDLLVEGTVFTTADVLDRVMANDDALDPQLAEWQRKYGGVQG